MAYKALRGTQDILPDAAPFWRHIEGVVRETMATFGYRQIVTPTFEHTSMFARSIGEETDIVIKEMYSFTDLGGREVTLRPEATPPVARAYLEHNLRAKRPLQKLFYIGPMYRQENPQKGRLRQFNQFGVEAIGSQEPALDVEVITLLLEVCRKLELAGLDLQVGSVGCPKCRPRHRAALRDHLADKLPELCKYCKVRYERNPLRILDCKSASCQEATKDAPAVLDFLCDECRDHFGAVTGHLSRLSVGHTINPRLVRGLDYYTKTIFELVSADLGAQGTVGAGGRYDGLIEMLGGDPTPGVGFAAGIERLIIVLKSRGISVPQQEGPWLYIANLGNAAKEAAVGLVHGLRKRGIPCDMGYLGRSLKAQMKAANRVAAQYVLILGEQELQSGRAILRDMADSTQEIVALDGIEESLAKRYS